MGYTRAEALYEPMRSAHTVERPPGNKLASSNPVKMYKIPPIPLLRTAGKTIQPNSNNQVKDCVHDPAHLTGSRPEMTGSRVYYLLVRWMLKKIEHMR